jgi:hypothetical protein
MLLLTGTRAVVARANNMTEEPDAVVPHVRIWVGAVG